MAARRHHYVECKILKIALQRYGECGYPTSLPQLETLFRQTLLDIADMVLVDAL